MHAVFRIGHVKQIENQDHLWEVQLTLTGDQDVQLQALTMNLQEDTSGPTG